MVNEGDAHIVGDALQVIGLVFFQGEDIGIARYSEQGLFDGAQLIYDFIEKPLGLHSRFALYHK